LENDVRNGITHKKSPLELQASKKSYQEFPPDIFCKRVHAEMAKQRGASFWVEKETEQQ